MYNANNQLIAVTDWNNRITTYEYDNNGRLIKENRPNGTYQTYTYNNAGQLTYTVDKTTDGKIINEYSYEYDADGNIITEDSINEPNYDNITIPSSEMNYGSANRLIDFNGIAISYDNDGNMLNTPLGNKWGILTYDSRNMLTDVVTSDGAIKYEYDAENNRTLKTEYGKTTSYVVNPNVSLSQVLTSTKDGETTYYIYGLGLISEEKADTYKTYHYDYRGSTTAITDINGNVTDRVYYDPYGSIVNLTGVTNTPFLYVGKYGVETDDNGLYYMRARYYNPTIQRFINIDPIRDGDNWYVYCDVDPIVTIDPLGLKNSYENMDSIQQYFVKKFFEDMIKSFNYTIDKAKYTVNDFVEDLDSINKLCKISYNQYPWLKCVKFVSNTANLHIGDVIVDSRVIKSALDVRLNKTAINDVSKKFGIPADIIGSIVYKEQFTQSIPDWVANMDTFVRGTSHSTGLGAIFPDIAINAWKFYGSEFKTSNIPNDEKSMQLKLTNDNNFNIKTIAVVLILKANNLNLIDKPSEISNLTEEQWKLVVGAYNADNDNKRIIYSNKVFEYRNSVKELLD